MEIFSFIFFLVLFAGVGLWSARKACDEDCDYLLAGQTVSPLLTALSAAATKNSGYMFIGLMGYVYTYGLSAIWLVCGFMFGDVIAFVFVHKRLREATEATGALSFADLLARWHGGNYRILRAVIGLVTLAFLTTYAAAQFNAGGKALQVLFGWDFRAGALIGAGLIIIYCFFGGLRASIWTDAGQSILMMVSMLMLLVTAVVGAGGFSGFFGELDSVSPSYLNFGTERFGSLGATALFAFGWLFNGIGVTGQPPVMVRFMALNQADQMKQTGIYYFLWSGTFLATTFLVGLATRIYIGDAAGFDAELALPTLAGLLLPGIFVGVIIGGVFAASMSTADSQVLSCAAVISEDFKVGQGANAKRFATFGVTIFALVIGIYASANVFTLVIFAWSALACSIGPLVILHALGGRPAEWVALCMMATGMSVALLWREFGLNAQVYEGLPGIASAFVIYAMLQPLARMPKEKGAT